MTFYTAVPNQCSACASIIASSITTYFVGLIMGYIEKVIQHRTFCTKKLQKFSSMKIEAYMVFHAVAENFNHCLFPLHLLDISATTASSTLSNTTPFTPPPTPDGEFYSKFGSSYSLLL